MKRHYQLAELHYGTSFYITPTNSLWYTLYIKNSPRSNKEKKLFHQRFCLPYRSFKKLETIKKHSFFERWTKYDAVGDPSVPIELLFLGFLQFAGRGFSNDDLEEATAIDAETHQQFIHNFKLMQRLTNNLYIIFFSMVQHIYGMRMSLDAHLNQMQIKIRFYLPWLDFPDA